MAVHGLSDNEKLGNGDENLIIYYCVNLNFPTLQDADSSRER